MYDISFTAGMANYHNKNFYFLLKIINDVILLYDDKLFLIFTIIYYVSDCGTL